MSKGPKFFDFLKYYLIGVYMTPEGVRFGGKLQTAIECATIFNWMLKKSQYGFICISTVRSEKAENRMIKKKRGIKNSCCKCSPLSHISFKETCLAYQNLRFSFNFDFVRFNSFALTLWIAFFIDLHFYYVTPSVILINVFLQSVIFIRTGFLDFWWDSHSQPLAI